MKNKRIFMIDNSFAVKKQHAYVWSMIADHFDTAVAKNVINGCECPAYFRNHRNLPTGLVLITKNAAKKILGDKFPVEWDNMKQVKYYIAKDSLVNRFSIWAHNNKCGRCYNAVSKTVNPSYFTWSDLDNDSRYQEITEDQLLDMCEHQEIDWKW